MGQSASIRKGGGGAFRKYHIKEDFQNGSFQGAFSFQEWELSGSMAPHRDYGIFKRGKTEASKGGFSKGLQRGTAEAKQRGAQVGFSDRKRDFRKDDCRVTEMEGGREGD